jgi:cytochrome c oxidase assembly factor CtaG
MDNNTFISGMKATVLWSTPGGALCDAFAGGSSVCYHGHGMADELAHWHWHGDPLALLLLLGAVTSYGLVLYVRRQRHGAPVPVWRALAYAGGLASLGMALFGPPHALNGVLFSAHMAQHLLLTLAAPLLLVLGRPLPLLLAALPVSLSRACFRPLRHPIAQTALGAALHPLAVVLLVNGVLLAWHVPTLYVAAVGRNEVHLLEHVTLFSTALLFWWFVLASPPQLRRPSTSTALLVVFVTWMVSDLLGAALTLAHDVFYPVYLNVSQPIDFAALEDQHRGGLLMWAGGGILYAATMLALLLVSYLRGVTVPHRRVDDTRTGNNRIAGATTAPGR